MNTTTLKHAPSMGVPGRLAPAGAKLLASVRRWYDGLGRYVAPRPLTRAEEAAALRARAFRLLSTEPGFAQDLLAAANRHEDLPVDAL